MSKRTRLRIRATDALGLTVNGGTWNNWDDMPTRAEMRLLHLILGLGAALVPLVLALSN